MALMGNNNSVGPSYFDPEVSNTYYDEYNGYLLYVYIRSSQECSCDRQQFDKSFI